MGLLDYMFEGGYVRRADIEPIKRQQSLARLARSRQFKRTQDQLKAMEEELGEMSLFCRAAVALMINKGLISSEEWAQQMRQVDASDGTVDGKYRPNRK